MIDLNPDERIDDLNLKGLKIIQNKKYFCFGTDSVLLANIVDKKPKKVALDLCSGSGIISVIMNAKCNFKKIIAVELQDEMFELLNKNIAINNLKDKVLGLQEDVKNVDNIRKAMLKLCGVGTADIIVCNPPYKAPNSGIKNPEDVKYIARHEVMLKLEDVFKTASNLLNTKGKLYLVHKPERLSDLLSIARNYRLETKKIQLLQPRKNTSPSIILIEYVKDGKGELKILPPIIEYDENGNYTNEFLKFYKE